MGSMVKKERNPTLVDVVFSWSIDDIMNNDLYKNKVNPIQETFPSLSYYLHSFIQPLIEETHADLCSNMTTLPSAPIVEIFQILEGDKFRPPENLLYELKLEESEKNSDVYEPEVGDLIALTEAKPKCIDDLQGAKLSFHLALVEGMRDEDTNFVPISSSKFILIDNADFKNSGEGNGGTKLRLFAVYLTNLTTNLRIWKALHYGEEGNEGILNSVLRVDPNVMQIEEKCALCSDRVESGGRAKIMELIMSLGLDHAQREAVLKCIALRECKHRNSVKLIWGPPGTGKTKTIASLLYSLLKMKCRTLTCAPTNVAVLGVVKRLMSCLKGYYGLGDVVLFGNGKRMNIIENEGLHDVFLDYRVSALLYCFMPSTGWRGSVDELVRLLQDPETQYERYLKNLKDKGDDDGDEDRVENGKLEEKLKMDFLNKLVKENAKKNKKVNSQEKRTSKCNGGDDDEKSRRKHKDEEKVLMAFEEFFATKVLSIGERIVLCTKLLYIHIPTSCLPLEEAKNMVKVAYMLHKLQNLFQNKKWSKEELMEKEFDLCVIRLKFLEFLVSLKAIQIPKFIERFEVRNFCLENSCLIFCTVSSSSKLHGTAPFDLAIIDEAAQVKECESTIPLQHPGLRHAILVGDEKQLPAMVVSEFCEKAGFGRSLFERLVLLGYNKHLLNVQYRMHPSISLFPNKEFYGNQIMNGPNAMESSHEKRFLKAKIFSSYSFINVTNGKEEFDNRNSRKNMVEVSVIAEIVSKLYKESMKSKEKVRVGCISPYKAQVFAIQESFGKRYSSDAKDKFSVNVRSVDGFQGGEEDIIIISTVRCNGNGSIGFLDNLKRTNVALTRARYCLWILGNAPTLQNSGSVWRRLVADAQNRGCFYNAYEDEDLGGAIRSALIELGHQRFLFTADSILFKAAKWKVRFSAGFYESLTRYKDPEIQKAAASLLEKLSNGWRHRHKDDEGICIEGEAAKLLEWDVVKGVLRLVWTTDILRENSTDTQVIKVFEILPWFEIAESVKKFEVLVGEHTVNQLNRCLYKRSEGGLVLPMTWPVDQANSRRNYSSNNRASSRSNYSIDDLATQLSKMSLRDEPTSPTRRSPSKWRGNY